LEPRPSEETRNALYTARDFAFTQKRYDLLIQIIRITCRRCSLENTCSLYMGRRASYHWLDGRMGRRGDLSLVRASERAEVRDTAMLESVHGVDREREISRAESSAAPRALVYSKAKRRKVRGRGQRRRPSLATGRDLRPLQSPGCPAQ